MPTRHIRGPLATHPERADHPGRTHADDDTGMGREEEIPQVAAIAEYCDTTAPGTAQREPHCPSSAASG
ncbi:hypothetical protein ACWD7C_38090 [Streptomyces sp. NPDC005134]|uniref:hypothetical protein n=1 Tax=unclassified Streptomyces TaxID=2593676 RepID=UPI0033A0E338